MFVYLHMWLRQTTVRHRNQTKTYSICTRFFLETPLSALVIPYAMNILFSQWPICNNTHSLLLYPCILQTNPCVNTCLVRDGRTAACYSHVWGIFTRLSGLHFMHGTCRNTSGMTAKQVIFAKAYSRILYTKLKGWTSVICIACQMKQWWRWRDAAEWVVMPCA